MLPGLRRQEIVQISNAATKVGIALLEFTMAKASAMALGDENEIERALMKEVKVFIIFGRKGEGTSGIYHARAMEKVELK